MGFFDALFPKQPPKGAGSAPPPTITQVGRSVGERAKLISKGLTFTLAKFADSFWAATAEARGKFADGFWDNSVVAKFADNLFAADAASRAKFADGIWTDLKVAAANKDGAAATPSLRTLGTGASQAMAGNQAASGDLTGTFPGPTIANLAVTDAKVAAANKDGAAATPSLRTLGTGAAQACAGNDGRLISNPVGGLAAGKRATGGVTTATTDATGFITVATGLTTVDGFGLASDDGNPAVGIYSSKSGGSVTLRFRDFAANVLANTSMTFAWVAFGT